MMKLNQEIRSSGQSYVLINGRQEVDGDKTGVVCYGYCVYDGKKLILN
jgi:hypothetical protein